ncbi:MAG TPA: SPFH domain-containing protein [Burkholderiales bacterium]|nr:SPFH domain-containing protein [Burkholderiales bacterium]
MIPKLVVAVILSAIVFAYPPTQGFAIPIFILLVAIVFVIEGVKVVPQQNAWVVERLGKYHASLEPGLNFIVPFIDRVAYRHSLKEVPLDVPEQVCITKDNTQLGVDGIIYFQVTDPRLASYGTSNYVLAITQLAQTTLRSEVGKMELDRTFESRDEINRQVVAVLDEAGRTWGVKVLRYEIKNLTPPEAILRAMQAQITAEREKRALIAKSEGKRQEEINLADGEKQAKILSSEGDKSAAINKASGEASAIKMIAEAQAEAVRVVGASMGTEAGLSAANLKVAELYVAAFKDLAKTNNTLIIPSNLSDTASFVASAMTVLDRAKAGVDSIKKA